MGILLKKKVGDYVRRGDVLALLHANDRKKLETARDRLLQAYRIGKHQRAEGPVILGVVR